MRSVLHPLPLLALAVLSCGGDPTPARAPSPPVAAATSSAGAKAVADAPPRFENPGGMWMPHQIAAHAAKLKELGLAIDPAALTDPTSGVLSAIVYLGGCSASFVSPGGLVATNHHCATGALQHNSSPSADLLVDGYLAKTRADEKSNGPQARVLVTRAVTDVTAKMREGLDAIADDKARYDAIEQRQKELIAACEKGRPGVRCSTPSFYGQASFYLVEQLELRDVRLVWAPPAGVGNYGGEIDNWRWPRHTGDVSLFRAYVGKDGQPADYSPDNVPYAPPHWLKIASDPLRAGDLVFVAGYPAHTNTLKTKAEVDEAVGWYYPRRQRLFEEYLARLERATKDDKEAQIRATSYVRSFGNALTNTKGQLEGLVKGGLAEEKERAEKELRAFVARPASGGSAPMANQSLAGGDPARKARWGSVLDDISAEVAKQAAFREKDAQRGELGLARLVGAASTIVRMAEERAKPDAARRPEYQARNWPRIEQGMVALSTLYHRKVDEAVLGLALERIARAPEGDRTPAFAMVLGAASEDASHEAIRKAVTALYAATTLGEEKTRLALLKKGTTASLRASKDPLIRLALLLRPLEKDAEDRAERFAGRMALLRPRYIDALRASKKEPFAPDANGTLRITYGTVRGYRPTPDAPLYAPFTVLSEMMAKDKGAPPFDVPAVVARAYEAKRFGPYVDHALGEVPVDFLADLHITGGNSGSATLNAKGELVGLAFDGNYEAMASDWVFVPSLTRSIHVDFRYVTWLLDGPFAGHHLLEEMGVKPRL